LGLVRHGGRPLGLGHRLGPGLDRIDRRQLAQVQQQGVVMEGVGRIAELRDQLLVEGGRVGRLQDEGEQAQRGALQFKKFRSLAGGRPPRQIARHCLRHEKFGGCVCKVADFSGAPTTSF